jgi:hypothetical protein
MITLVANTVTKLLKSEKVPRMIRISSDSTTVTCIDTDQGALEAPGTGGYGITAYESVLVELPAGKELFAVSAGTPNISWSGMGMIGLKL